MTRVVGGIALQVVLAIVVALILGALWQWLLSGHLMEGLAEGSRLLFFFMDVGLAVWVAILIFLTVRQRKGPGVAATFVAAAIGVVVNVLTVTVVGFAQGGWKPLFVTFAIEAGITFLLAVLITAPIIHSVLPARAEQA
jgi:hypothetical protein